MKRYPAIQLALRAMLLPLVLAALAPAAIANSVANDKSTLARHKTTTQAATEKHAVGKPGDPKKVARTIAIDMHDTMRFIPGEIAIKQGETIRFVVSNKGKTLHEMVLGTMDELKSHNEMLQQHPGRAHDETGMTHVGAGKQGQMVWKFTEAGEFYYACLLPGHFAAGMVGKITVTKG